MHILFLFLDGVGLGDDDPAANPFAIANVPVLTGLTMGNRWLRDTGNVEGERATFMPVDANLGVEGKPQSATGQATILTGLNVSKMLGYHYGPKPNEEIDEIVGANSLFARLVERGRSAALINAYPPRYFEAIESGKRKYSVVPHAVSVAGLALFDKDELMRGEAMSADFTGEGWRNQLGFEDAPLYEARQAGAHLAELAQRRDFTFFEHWPTDIVGHRGTLDEAVAHLEQLDAVMGGLVDAWDDDAGVIFLTSDHGNIEDMSQRGHTYNPVPALLVGEARHRIAVDISDLTGFTPAILSLLDAD